jgi:hypothetical protein
MQGMKELNFLPQVSWVFLNSLNTPMCMMNGAYIEKQYLT